MCEKIPPPPKTPEELFRMKQERDKEEKPDILRDSFR